jgi:NAD(P)-dependent dehydrogenase (short-subunit alcohol dehydrogenase family)
VSGALAGKRVVVTGTESDFGRALLHGVLGGGPSHAAGIATRALETKGQVELQIDRVAEHGGGPIDVVVHAAVPEVAFEAIDLADVDDARWEAVWEGTMRTTLFVLQAAFRQMAGRGGAIVLVTPTVAMSGAERLVPYTTAVEGQRLLAKSAARQWGPDGIRVNCVAPAPEQVPIGVESMSVSLAPPALGGPGDVVDDVAPVVVWLASDAAHFVTGVTVCADGGVWMAP